ncbi:microtubule-associated protein Jupiter [Toxorhynchites rutilus septentrionalis]|uniref:microtubule-associated protein Jupiter n=1 Tax=Toxorhynchites rutilus septentrionalis TaxID=329112 RepID=UPI00247A6A07|nr:microtubule-associated protein Jupiter [Toxorhynchites rutilus septentrionalis]
MSSTEFNIGITDMKTSSRVLKPPGGGHSDIFGSSEVKVNPPRPNYNQQNSSNMNTVMGTTDPNTQVQQLRNNQTIAGMETDKASSEESVTQHADRPEQETPMNGRTRVPPGGYSSGLW